MNWTSIETAIPEAGDYAVLVHFENGSIETVGADEFFGLITDGVVDGVKQYTRWYLSHEPKITHWLIPEPPKTENI